VLSNTDIKDTQNLAFAPWCVKMGHLLKLKYAQIAHQVRILASTIAPFRPTMVQMQN
jgi:hypothetical protein